MNSLKKNVLRKIVSSFTMALFALTLFADPAMAANSTAYIDQDATGSKEIQEVLTKLGYQLVDRISDADIVISTEFARHTDDSTPCRIGIEVSGSQNLYVGASKYFYSQLMFSFIGCKNLVIKRATKDLYQRLIPATGPERIL